jgi:hypothetical protein
MILLGLNANEVCHAFHTILKKRADGIENMRNRAARKLNGGHWRRSSVESISGAEKIAWTSVRRLERLCSKLRP